MTTAVVVDEVDVYEEAPPPRWLLVAAGVMWLIVAMVMLSLDPTGAAALGFLVGIMILLAGVEELVQTFVSPSWKWVHALLGVLFVIGGVLAFVEPFQTFGILALFIGWYLLIKGFFDIFLSVSLRNQLPLWGLVLASGILEVFIGLWAIGYPGRSAWLVLIWVGVGALLRGVGDLVAAFTTGGHS